MDDRRFNRTAELRRFLKQQLVMQIYPAGSALPSARVLAKKFSLCYNAAQRVLLEFCASGQLESVPRRGFFVKQSELSSRCIGVVLPQKRVPDGLIEQAWLAIEKHAIGLGYPLKIIETPENWEMPEEILAEIRRMNAAVLLGEYDLHGMRGLPDNIPLAGVLLHDDFSGRFSLVELDPFQSARLALDHFRKHGIRKVWIFSNDFPVNMTRCRIFEYIWKAAGGIAQFCTLSGRESSEQFQLPEPGCGCYFGEDDLGRTVSRYYRERTGTALFAGCRGFSVGGKCLTHPDYEPVPSHVPDWRLMGITALEEAVIRLNNPLRPPRRIYLSGRFVNPGNFENRT